MRASHFQGRNSAERDSSIGLRASRLTFGLALLGLVIGASSELLAEDYPSPMVSPGGHMMMPPGSLQQVANFQPVPGGGGSVIVPNQAAGVSTFENIVGQRVAAPFGPRAGFTTQLDDSMGNNGNLYTVFGFLPYFVDSGDALFFMNLDASVTERGDGLFNFGAGFREYDSIHDRILTLEGHLIADEGHSKTFFGAGFAVQSLGKYTDHQLSANFVIGDKSNQVSSTITGSAFSGNNIVLTRTRTNEQAYSIVEYMWGGRVPFLGEYGLSSYVGGYYTWNEEAREAVGVKVRSDWQITEDISTGFTYTNDKVFGREAFAQITMTLPDGKPKKWFRPNQVYDRLGERIIHNHRIATGAGSTAEEELAINPADGQPFFISFVDPNRTATGVGTFESPFDTLEAGRLANNAATDVLFVYRRADGSTTNLGVTTAFQLFNNQQLLSDGVQHTINSVQGAFPLPFTAVGAGDSLAGIFNENNSSTESVVSLASNNTVSGFRIIGSDLNLTTVGQGITNSGAISGFTITNNEFSQFSNAIALTDVGNGAGATGLINNNTVTGTAGTSLNGIQVSTDTAGATLALSLQSNTVTGSGTGTTPSGAGVSITANSGTTINANDPTGDPSLGIIGNTITGNGSGFVATTNGTGVINAVVDGNVITGNTDTNTGFRAVSAGTINLTSFVNNTVTNNNGNGILFLADGGLLTVGTFGNNTSSANDGSGLLLEADNGGILDINVGAFADPNDIDSVDQPNQFIGNGATDGDGIRMVVRNNGTVRGSIANNTITGTVTGGAIAFRPEDTGGVIDFGTTASSRSIFGNVLSNNAQSGFVVQSNAIPSGDIDMIATLVNNAMSTNLRGGIDVNMTGSNNVPPTVTTNAANNTLNLIVSGSEDLDADGMLGPGEDLNLDGLLTTSFTNQAIAGNSDAGIGIDITGNAFARVTVQDLDITGTIDNALTTVEGGSGIFFNREDTSLLLATIRNVNLNNNAADGFTMRALGNEPNDPNQVARDTPNTLTLTDVSADTNLGNGFAYRGFADSATLATMTRISATNNIGDGIEIFVSEDAAFGDPTAGVPPGARSVLDGITVTNNDRSGVVFQANNNARIVAELTSTAQDSTISNNVLNVDAANAGVGGNGIDVINNGGQSDVLISSGGTFRTTIADNGNATTGSNGINLTVGGTATSTLTVQSTTISGSVADATGANGDGIRLDISGSGSPQVVLGGTTANLSNFIRNNQGDGIHITSTGDENSRPTIEITNNIIGGNATGNGGNGGHGVFLDVDGGIGTGADASATGSLVTAIFNGNQISENILDGVHIELTGAMGTRDREQGQQPNTAVVDLAQIRFLNQNSISSNGGHGIFYSANAAFLENREVLLGNFGFPNDDRMTEFDAAGAAQVDGDQAFFAGSRVEFASLNLDPNQSTIRGGVNQGSVGNATSYTGAAAQWLNLRTASNSQLVIVGNTIQNNGTGTVAGEGVFVEVGLNTYVAGDVRNNVFGGNLNNDVRTESISEDITGSSAALSLTALSHVDGGSTFQQPDPMDPMNTLPYDQFYLDDSAQLDLRFASNSGDQIQAMASGATLTNDDPGKRPSGTSTGATRTNLTLFQIDDGNNLNQPNNTFINSSGVTQDVEAEFANNGFNLRAGADPTFPSIFFPPPQP